MPNGASKIKGEDFEALIEREMETDHFRFRVERLDTGLARLRLFFDPRQLRPGRTIAGPVMFTLADTALYAAVMTVAGMVPLAVTTDLGIRFLRRPKPADLLAEARLIKPHGRLVVGEVTIWSDGEAEPVAHCTGGYAVPRGGGGGGSGL